MRAAFLGLGLMGAPMAERLLEGGVDLAVWNRTSDKAASLTARGARLAASPADAVAGAEFVLLMLSDEKAVEEILFEQGVAEAATVGAIVIDCSSISPAAARAASDRLREHGIHHIDAPVSGGPSGAASARLAIMAGGEAEAFARVQSLLACLGSATHVGPSGAGQVAKLVNQIIVGMAIAAVSEGILLAESSGVDPETVRKAMRGGFADSLVLQIHGSRMINRDFAPGAVATLHLKDMENIVAAAREVDLDLPFSTRLKEAYRALVEHGDGNLDHSALFLEIERRSR